MAVRQVAFSPTFVVVPDSRRCPPKTRKTEVQHWYLEKKILLLLLLEVVLVLMLAEDWPVLWLAPLLRGRARSATVVSWLSCFSIY